MQFSPVIFNRQLESKACYETVSFTFIIQATWQVLTTGFKEGKSLQMLILF